MNEYKRNPRAKLGKLYAAGVPQKQEREAQEAYGRIQEDGVALCLEHAQGEKGTR